MSAPIVELFEVSKVYHLGAPWARRSIEALKPLSLRLRLGEMLAVVGESGSGKTTLAKLCLGLIQPTSGQMSFSGMSFPRRSRVLRGKLAAVMQNPAASLNPRLKIGSSIAEPMWLAGGSSPSERKRRVDQLLEQVGLPARIAERYPNELSGGQRQRVTIARALSTSPQLIIFDEAVSALDVSVQAQVLNLITELQREVGFAGMFITHDLAVARYVSDKVLVMRRGVVETEMPAKDLYQPAPAGVCARTAGSEWTSGHSPGVKSASGHTCHFPARKVLCFWSASESAQQRHMGARR